MMLDLEQEIQISLTKKSKEWLQYMRSLMYILLSTICIIYKQSDVIYNIN